MNSPRWACHLLIYLLLFILGITAQGKAEAAQLSLTWTDNSTYEDGFQIERKTTTNGTFIQIAVLGPDTTAYTESGLADGTIYCYRVRAFNEIWYSDYSNEACKSTPVIASAVTSLITAAPASITANGTSTSTITVQLEDEKGNNLTTGGDTVALSTTLGTLSTVIDNGNGTYTATLTSATTTGTATIVGTVNGSTITNNAAVSFTPGVASAVTSLFTAAPASITANGTSTSTITVQLEDVKGNNLTTGGDTVALSTTLGTLSTVIDNGNGTYTATLISAATTGTATIVGTVNGSAITNSATVSFTPGAASAVTSLFTAAPASITANGISTSTITVQLEDLNDNNLTTGGDTVALSTTLGTLSTVIDNGNGTYTATLTSATTTGTATIIGTVNGSAITNSATVNFVTFSTSDLAGTWYFYGFSDLTSSNDPGWSRGTLTIDSTGSVTGGSWVDGDGSSVTITSGSLSLDSTGVGSGSVTDSSGINMTLTHFKMNSNKTIATGVSIDSDNYRGTGVLIKDGGTFSTSDLAGTWYFYGYSDLNSSNNPGWSRAMLTLDSSGAVTDGNRINSDGSSVTITSGSLSLDSSGVGSGSVTDSSGVTTTLSHFKMDSNKTIATGVSIDSDNYRGTEVLVKDGGTFFTSDLAGTWYFYGYSDLNSSNDPGWGRAMLTLDSTGLVTDGNWVDSDGSSVTITSGSLSLDSTGVGSGSVTDSSGVTTTLPHFKMDSNKTIATGVSVDGDSYLGIGMLIRTDSAQAELTSPTPGSTLTSSSVTLTWSNGAGVSEYWLYLGTTPGGYDIYNGSQGTNLSRTITGLPTDGSTIYVRLFSAIGDGWSYNDYTYSIDCSGCGTAAAEMISPAPGSTLSSSSVTFTWSSGAGESNYVLQVGTTSGAANIYIGLQGTNLSRTITGLPTDGSTIYVRLYSAIGGGWSFNDYTYTATLGTPELSAVTPKCDGTTSGIELQWSAVSNASQYEIYRDGSLTTPPRTLGPLSGTWGLPLDRVTPTR